MPRKNTATENYYKENRPHIPPPEEQQRIKDEIDALRKKIQDNGGDEFRSGATYVGDDDEAEKRLRREGKIR